MASGITRPEAVGDVHPGAAYALVAAYGYPLPKELGERAARRSAERSWGTKPDRGILRGVAALFLAETHQKKRHKPESFAVQEVYRDGVPRGEVSVLLKSVVRDGKTVAWDAVFALERPNADYRLLTEGHWQDRDCTKVDPIDPDQFARWTFRVKTGGAS